MMYEDEERWFATLETGDANAVARWLEERPGAVCWRRVKVGEDGKTGRADAWATSLQVAAEAGRVDLVQLLIDKGAAIYESAQWGYPAVAHAHWAKQAAVVDYLLGAGAGHESMQGAPTFGLGIDVNLAARLGWKAVVARHLAVDKLAVHRRGVIGETPLHWAAHNGELEIVGMLLDAGADIEADEIGCYGGKALHWASEHSPEVVKMLLARGANVEGRNVKAGAEYEGVTPLLMVATQKADCAECTRILLAAGADVHARDAKGRTGADWARARGATKVEAVLRAAGG